MLYVYTRIYRPCRERYFDRLNKTWWKCKAYYCVFFCTLLLRPLTYILPCNYVDNTSVIVLLGQRFWNLLYRRIPRFQNPISSIPFHLRLSFYLNYVLSCVINMRGKVTSHFNLQQFICCRLGTSHTKKAVKMSYVFPTCVWTCMKYVTYFVMMSPVPLFTTVLECLFI